MPIPGLTTTTNPLVKSTSAFINNVTSKNQFDPGVQANTAAASSTLLPGVMAQQQAYQGKLNSLSSWNKGLTATTQEGNLRRRAQEAARQAAAKKAAEQAAADAAQRAAEQRAQQGIQRTSASVRKTSGGAAQQQTVSPYTGDVSQTRNELVANAQSRLGTGYAWGGGGYNNYASRGTGYGTQGVTGVDCSGLTQWAYGTVGVKLPRTSQGQTGGTVGIRTAVSNARPGDLIGFPGGGHVAMYIGGGMMVESPKPGGHVQDRKVPANAFAVHISLPGD